MLQTKNYKNFQVGNISFDDYHQANRCLPGDSVEWDGKMCVLQKRANHRTLVGLLELNSKYIYGHTSRGVKIYLFHPFDTSYPPMRVGCSEKNTSINQLALVQFDSWTETIPRGNLLRLLGPVGNLDAEKLALQWLYGKPELQKQKLEVEVPEEDRPSLPGFTFNIDPPGCKDIDDVLTFHKIQDNLWNIYITIADVAHSIQEGSLADHLAKEKGQTLYQNGVACLPMLPKELSEEKLSLLPSQRRYGVSLHLLWDGKDIQVQGFQETLVTNQKSYTYETFPLTAEKEIVEVLKAVASCRKGTETDDPHEWIEQCMLLYNMEVAKHLEEEKAGLVRTHTAAKAEQVAALQSIHPDLIVYAYQSAKYEFAGEGKLHASLGLYTHCTSPLRRYADLINQRVLKRKGCSCSLQDAEHLNLQQKKQKRHDRDLFFLEQILKDTTGSLAGIAVEKEKVFIPQWKRIVKVKGMEDVPGTPVTIEYFADLRKVSWKDRIVFRV